VRRARIAASRRLVEKTPEDLARVVLRLARGLLGLAGDE